MKTKMAVVLVCVILLSIGYFLFAHKEGLVFFASPGGDGEGKPKITNSGDQVDVLGKTQSNTGGGAHGDFFTSGISFDLVKQKAESGDAEAQRVLSEMYEDCMSYSLSPDNQLKWLDFVFDQGHASRKRIDEIKKNTVNFCRKVDGGQPIPAEAYQLWLKNSAESGDLVAEIRQSTRPSGSQDGFDIESIAKKVMDSKNPEALYELSNLLPQHIGKWEDEREANLFGTAYSQRAMEIAACRIGMNCGPDSRLMRLVCVSSFRCNYSNYEEYVFSELSAPAERREIERLASEIVLVFSH